MTKATLGLAQVLSQVWHRHPARVGTGTQLGLAHPARTSAGNQLWHGKCEPWAAPPDAGRAHGAVAGTLAGRCSALLKPYSSSHQPCTRMLRWTRPCWRPPRTATCVCAACCWPTVPRRAPEGAGRCALRLRAGTLTCACCCWRMAQVRAGSAGHSRFVCLVLLVGPSAQTFS